MTEPECQESHLHGAGRHEGGFPVNPAVDPAHGPGPDQSAPDPVRGLVGFTAVLRHAGLRVTTERVAAFLTAVDALGTGREQVYRAGVHTLCADPDDLPRYERAFIDWFDAEARPGRPRQPARKPRLSTLLPSGTGAGDGQEEEEDGPQVRASASGAEVLRHHDLGELSLTERAHLRALLALLRPEPPTRPSRRRAPARRGAADPRRTLRAALHTDGELCVLARRDRSRRPRKVVLLVDVSGSMDELSGTQTKWQLSRAALGAFVKDPGSTGLGVGLSFFPSKTIEEMKTCTADQDCAGISDPIAGACRMEGFCFAPGVPLLTNRLCSPRAANNPFNCPAGLTCKPRGRCPQSGGPCVEGGEACPGGAADRCVTIPGICRTVDEDCNVTAFGKLDLDVSDLPNHADAVIAALAAREPDGATPMALGVDSALTALFARQKAQPQRRPVLVLATDGQPSGCG